MTAKKRIRKMEPTIRIYHTQQKYPKSYVNDNYNQV